ncbi:MAG: hypothetical protein ACLVDG_00345 [Coprococcus sp.]
MSNFDYEKDIVESYKRKGFDVSFQDVNEVREICKAKLKAAKFEDKRFYMPILFADEMKNYIYRKTINEYSLEVTKLSETLKRMAVNMQKKMGVFLDVCDMHEDTM